MAGLAYNNSRIYGAESNDACKATLTEGLPRTTEVNAASTTRQSRHEVTEPKPIAMIEARLIIHSFFFEQFIKLLVEQLPNSKHNGPTVQARCWVAGSVQAGKMGNLNQA